MSERRREETLFGCGDEILFLEIFPLLGAPAFFIEYRESFITLIIGTTSATAAPGQQAQWHIDKVLCKE